MHDSTEDRSVTLTLTTRCNLNCIYCYENNKSNRSMPIDVAKRILDERFKDLGDGKLYIELFGGEPFLEFNLIKELYDYIDGNYFDKDWIMFATTNGTLVHGDVQKWLGEHKRMICGLSLDGDKTMHDLNRSYSFDMIDLDFFRRQYPEQKIKMTISQATLPMLARGVIFAHEAGFKINCNLAFGIEWDNPDNMGILEEQLNQLIEYYLEHPDIEPCSILNNPIGGAALTKKTPYVRKWCGTGTDMRAYYVDGSAYPCQFFMPISAGEEKARPIDSITFKKEIPMEEIDEKCRDCIAIDICPTCYGSNYVSTGNIYSKDDNYCKLMKIILKARSYFKAFQWKRGLLKLDERQEQALLKSIVLIQNNF